MKIILTLTLCTCLSGGGVVNFSSLSSCSVVHSSLKLEASQPVSLKCTSLAVTTEGIGGTSRAGVDKDEVGVLRLLADIPARTLFSPPTSEPSLPLWREMSLPLCKDPSLPLWSDPSRPLCMEPASLPLWRDTSRALQSLSLLLADPSLSPSLSLGSNLESPAVVSERRPARLARVDVDCLFVGPTIDDTVETIDPRLACREPLERDPPRPRLPWPRLPVAVTRLRPPTCEPS